MNDQRDLFAAPPTAPYQPHSPTSREAARYVAPDLNRLQLRVLAFISDNPLSNDERIQRGLHMNPSTQRPRRIELLRKGLIRQDGKSKTTAGRWAASWVITPEGRAALRN